LPGPRATSLERRSNEFLREWLRRLPRELTKQFRGEEIFDGDS
jgi:hypothetical protein